MVSAVVVALQMELWPLWLLCILDPSKAVSFFNLNALSLQASLLPLLSRFKYWLVAPPRGNYL